MIILTLEADADSYYKINTFLPIEIAIMNIIFSFGWIGIMLRNNKKMIVDKK